MVYSKTCRICEKKIHKERKSKYCEGCLFPMCSCGCGKQVITRFGSYIKGHSRPSIYKRTCTYCRKTFPSANSARNYCSNCLSPGVCQCGCKGATRYKIHRFINGHGSIGKPKPVNKSCVCSICDKRYFASNEASKVCYTCRKPKNCVCSPTCKTLVITPNRIYANGHGPEARKAISLGVKNTWASLTNAERITWTINSQTASSTTRKQNKAEAWLQSLCPPCVDYTGNRSFFVRFPDRAKNPDFIVRPYSQTKKVIELFGDYWHSSEEESSLLKSYGKLGIECLIIWYSELLTDQESVKGKIEQFVNWIPTEHNLAILSKYKDVSNGRQEKSRTDCYR